MDYGVWNLDYKCGIVGHGVNNKWLNIKVTKLRFKDYVDWRLSIKD